MNKTLNRALALIVALVCLLTVPFAALAEVAEGADSDWYMAVLADERILDVYPYHAFIDLNGDGVPVLIISTTEDDFITDADRAAVYVYADGEAKNVLEVGGGGGDIFYANLDEKTLTHFSRLSGEGHIEVFHVEDGALKPVTHADYYGPHHYPEQDSEEPLYFQDDAPVAEAEGEAMFELYTAEDAAVTYEPMA